MTTAIYVALGVVSVAYIVASAIVCVRLMWACGDDHGRHADRDAGISNG